MMLNRNLTVLLTLISATLSANAGVTTQREAPLLAMASFPNPNIDDLHLNWMFDHARLGINTTTRAAQKEDKKNNKAGTPLPLKSTNQSSYLDITGLPKEAYPEIPVPINLKIYNHAFTGFISHPETTDRYDPIILKYAKLYNLDPRLIKAVIAAESSFSETARSPKGAKGLMQIVPRTAASFGVSSSKLFIGEYNIAAGSAYLASLFRNILKKLGLENASFKDTPSWVLKRVIAAYHAGPRFLHNPKLFHATKDYVRKVMLFYKSPVSELRNVPKPSPFARLIAKF